ncbi:MAG: hypothetical protein QXO12_02030 [Candidatus Pacearchaeota archaeon]
MKIKKAINNLFLHFLRREYSSKSEFEKLLNEVQHNYFLFVKYGEMKNILENKDSINWVDMKMDSLCEKLKNIIIYLIENYYDNLVQQKELSKILIIGKKLNNLDDIILAISFKEKNFEMAKELIFEKIRETGDKKYIDMIEKLKLF